MMCRVVERRDEWEWNQTWGAAFGFRMWAKWKPVGGEEGVFGGVEGVSAAVDLESWKAASAPAKAAAARGPRDSLSLGKNA